MARLVSLGSINADFVVRADQLPSGPGSVSGAAFRRASGGKGANVAVAAARLGADVLLLGCVGDDDLIAQALAGPTAAGVDLSGVRRRPGPTGYAGIVVPPDGAKSIVRAANANDAWGDEAEAVAAEVAAVPDGSVLVADLEVPVALVRAALGTARRRGLPTVLDPAPTDLVDDDLLALTDHAVPDSEETEALTGVDPSSVDAAVDAAGRLAARGARNVHVKLADGGCVTRTPDATVVVRAPEVDVVDATGAGDAFAGVLGWALLHGASVPEAARLAVAASTCGVTGDGSQEPYPTRDELRAMADRVEIQPLR